MDFTFVMRSEIDKDEIKYYLELEDWTETYLDIFVNFTDPMQISKGLNAD